MNKLNRRDFMKGAARIPAGTMVLNFATARGQDTGAAGISATIPMPIQVVIDDVGWWSGHNGSKEQQPYRTGIARDHVPEDYQAIATLGRTLGIRPQAVMILCEWDRHNILRKLPTSTWMGADWDNSKWVGPWLDKAAGILRDNAEHVEITMHGIGHEYWTDGKFTRAEWAERNGTMRPPDQVEAHLDAFAAILEQNQLGPFPTSFVPTAFLHGFGPTNGYKESAAAILGRRGINYINTPYDTMHNREAVDHGVFGFDAGVITVDRGRDALEWYNISTIPTRAVHGPTRGMHWPNLLHLDPQRNPEIVEGWVRFLRPLNERAETMLAPNSMFFRTQLVHHVCTQLTLADLVVRLDFTKTDALPRPLGEKEITLKIKSPGALRFESESIKVASETSMKQEGANLYTVRLERVPGRAQAELKLITEG